MVGGRQSAVRGKEKSADKNYRECENKQRRKMRIIFIGF